ncbi:CyP450 monooxygenase [Trametes versicolor FP-101664 SS1]|uniref:CyP450 monooxygenase n=1 Tax=Trametes versicolor (strain FP-101664) TaxID=717944 RepID=UPI0004623C6C|nr:CyP450 monooxygenase [Trametes versicolor FP-101664 SS1]EIW55506.1 CyP450 monooxygenase [Trametes versicolor FP-101664 SS1]
MPQLWLFVLSAAVSVWLLRYWRTSRRRLPLPPGPRPLPIIGNVLDMPGKNSGAEYRELSDKYGDLVYLDVLGQPILLLGTHEAAIDLLDKRSALYSDRVHSPMVNLGGFDWVLTMIHYGPLWRRHRRAFHQFFNPSAITQLRPMQRSQVNHFLHRLLDTPEQFTEHIRHLFAATIMRVAYGIEVAEENDEYVTMAEEGLAAFSSLLVPGKYLVELFPILRFLPRWLPGVRFKRDAAEARVVVHRLRDTPWERTLAAMGTVNPSMTTALMERNSALEGVEAEKEEIVARNTVAVAYGAGADTTLSSIQAFFLVLASFPEVQKKAQAELDAVVGPHRLPDFADQDSLPYVSAVIKECLRWHAIVPLGIPHRLMEDDEYRGYFIPKGTLAISNIWAYSRDESLFPDPDVFMPERFLKDGKLNPDITDPAVFAFGYGRRVCPGRHFVEASLFLVVSSVLHTLAVSAPLDESGRPVYLEGKVTAGVISYPEPFECVIKARAPWAEALIRASDQIAASSATALGLGK